ncbi:MAG: hypothetical protein Ta2F_15060 [Termitinemataceae bacterium]|nr:MAG: hypothetical protein Ta2F_15060 [Termitinemataceae bacterium]
MNIKKICICVALGISVCFFYSCNKNDKITKTEIQSDGNLSIKYAKYFKIDYMQDHIKLVTDYDGKKNAIGTARSGCTKRF